MHKTDNHPYNPGVGADAHIDLLLLRILRALILRNAYFNAESDEPLSAESIIRLMEVRHHRQNSFTYCIIGNRPEFDGRGGIELP